MRPVAVVTDSCHYLPTELVAANNIRVVSLYVTWNDSTEREVAIADLHAYYEHLRTAEVLPTTSAPSPEDFLAVYQQLLDDGYDIASIHLSHGISKTFDVALEAKAATQHSGGTDERISVIDSGTACGGLGLIVLAAAKAAATGADLSRVVERTTQAQERLKVWFYVDTLEFLRRGGRIGAARAWLGSTLKIKPILTLDGEVAPVERVRTGTRARERMIDYLRSRHEDGADTWMVQHVQAADQVAEIVQAGREIFDSEPAFISEVGPVIGTHAGPGMLAVGGLEA